MVRRIAWLAPVGLVGLALLYISRFWIFELWGGEGLFGWSALPPGGDLLRRWLRGTMAAPFDVVIWTVGSYLILTVLERAYDRLK